MALTDAHKRDPLVCLLDTLSPHSDVAEGQHQQHRNTASAHQCVRIQSLPRFLITMKWYIPHI